MASSICKNCWYEFSKSASRSRNCFWSLDTYFFSSYHAFLEKCFCLRGRRGKFGLTFICFSFSVGRRIRYPGMISLKIAKRDRNAYLRTVNISSRHISSTSFNSTICWEVNKVSFWNPIGCLVCGGRGGRRKEEGRGSHVSICIRENQRANSSHLALHFFDVRLLLM